MHTGIALKKAEHSSVLCPLPHSHCFDPHNLDKENEEFSGDLKLICILVIFLFLYFSIVPKEVAMALFQTMTQLLR